ncbi:MAG TPA: toll/interleukin-1 receptor domain-containing protein [Thermoanaerobaculia bacterium]|jgi:hypothetical protein|nr:toll/interleukin-1 receptor domain-containing protein [Thermoanaerobaculia bacterium]
MALKLNQRKFDLFLSHAHADREFVSTLRRWLKEQAGLEVWFDDQNFDAGSWVGRGLVEAVPRCRGLLIVVTEHSMKSNYVRAEYNAAWNQFIEFPGFHLVALRVGQAKVESWLKELTWIDVPKPELDANTAYKILRALYPDGNTNPTRARDVYISCSWQQRGSDSARAVSKHLVEQYDFRLIGDAKDQKGFDPAVRIERIMSSCGAFVAVVPFRDGVTTATSTADPYQYFLQEIDLARKLSLPCVVIADPQVRRTEDPGDAGWVRMNTSATECPPEVVEALSDLNENWSKPSKPHYIFCALDLDEIHEHEETYERLLQVIERVTGMEAVVKVDEMPIHEGVARKLREALLVVADITDNNVNRCVEAGIAHAAGVRVELVAKGERRKLPFMLRAMTPTLDKTYKNHVEQIGVFHKIVRPYRRRVINVEL